MKWLKQLTLLAVTAIVVGCGGSGPADPQKVGSRLSSSVAFVFSQPQVQTFLQGPGDAYVQAYVRFPADLAPDVWFGIDQEFVEGVDDPIHFEGADWMGLFAVNRAGQLGTPIGSEDSHDGDPDDAVDWDIEDLGVTLQPDTWYLLRGDVDFATLTFKRFQINGPGVDVAVDLSGKRLSYPNYIPFDKPFLTFYVFSLRALEYEAPGSSIVYFDDLSAGIQIGGVDAPVFSDGFELQAEYPDIPVSLPVSPLSAVMEFLWYKERPEAVISVSDAFQRSGNFSIACDATLFAQ